jgi:3-ketosteroid 9alpha-monooxygenase subunit B
MAMSMPSASRGGVARDHGFHPLRIRRVVAETADAGSLVLDVPDELRAAFAYEAGQFCTFRVWVDGAPRLRCYSMSSAPAVDRELAVTVKRVPGGLVSNWMLDNLGPGDEVEATAPAGAFRLAPGEGDVVAYSGGSGITPVFSLVKTVLATTRRRVRLLYANRDPDAVIFGRALDDLAARHPDRLDIVHRYDVEHGYVDAEAVHAALPPGPAAATAADVYVCGPGPFMDAVEAALLDRGVGPERIHIERFTPGEPDLVVAAEEAGEDGAGPAASAGAATTVTIDLDGRVESTAHRPGTTILQAARQLGMAPPFSCESGSCATCMAKLLEGSVSMHVNNALTDDEVSDGWVLTCQSVPTSTTVRVRYGYDD